MQSTRLIKSNAISPPSIINGPVYQDIRDTVVITMPDDSMSETIECRDQLLIDTTRYHFFEDGIYYFKFNGLFFVKRLQDIGGPMLVISDNKQYQTWRLGESEQHRIQIIGRIAQVCQIKTFHQRRS